MRFWELALVMILFNSLAFAMTSSGVFTEMGINTTIPYSTDVDSDISELESKVRNSTQDQITSTDVATSIFGVISDTSVKIITFFDTIISYIWTPKVIMLYFGVPSQIASVFTAIFVLIEVVGLIQFITGKSMREME